MTPIRVRIPAEIKTRIQELAKRDGLDVSSYVRQAVMQKLRKDERSKAEEGNP